MARAAERALPRGIAAGLVNVKDTARLRRIQLHECGHPVPDQRGADGAARIAGLAASAGPDDLVLCLISGGASALLPLPAEGITLAEKQDTTRQLLACGANIHEMNALKIMLSSSTNGIAVIVFIASRAVYWREAVIMIIGASLGGYFGARYSLRLPQKWVRRFVISVGSVMTAYFFVRAY